MPPQSLLHAYSGFESGNAARWSVFEVVNHLHCWLLPLAVFVNMGSVWQREILGSRYRVSIFVASSSLICRLPIFHDGKLQA